jgi:hypothetical protein
MSLSINKKIELTEIPFNTERLLKAVEESSKRSRTVLLIMTFSALIVGISLVNSFKPEYNWYSSKLQLHKDILNHFYIPSDFSNQRKTDSIVYNLSDYYKKNEILFRDKIDSFQLISICNEADSDITFNSNIYIKSPSISPILISNKNERIKKYRELSIALKYLYDHDINNRESLINLISHMDFEQIEHMDIVKVPILGITFHVNYLGIYSGFLFTVLYVIFYFSLLREKINLKITFKRGWVDLKQHHYYLYEYASMLQVLSIPKKLFTHRKRNNFTFYLFSKVTIFLPFFIFLFVIFYDIYTSDLGNQTNRLMTLLTLSLDITFGVFIFFYLLKAKKQWKDLDELWDMQALEFNLEYIFESIGEDNEEDLIKLFEPKLTKKDLPKIKVLWFQMLENFSSKQKIYNKSETFNFVSDFVRAVFKTDSNSLCSTVEKENTNYEEQWRPLVEWFNNKGKRNVSSNFQVELHKVIMNLIPKAIN